MKHIKHHILFIILFNLSGCAYIESLDENLLQKTDSLIITQQYGKALDILYFVEPTHPDYRTLQKKKKHIQLLADKLERNALKHGMSLSDKGQLFEALEFYDETLKKIPDSTAIQKSRQTVYDKRKLYLEKLQIRLLDNKSKWLAQNEDVRHEIARIIPRNFTARWLLSGHRSDVDDTFSALLECSQDALNSDRLKHARNCMDIARHLRPSPELQNKSIKLEKQLEKETAARARKLNRQSRALLTATQKLISAKKYAQAQQTLAKISEPYQKNHEVQAVRKTLNEFVHTYVAEQFNIGRNLYSEGKYIEAYSRWQQLAKLEPDNQRIQSHLARVEKVINKIQQLRSKQGATDTALTK